ncbi:GyrI-like domain-containing protein [uncultured Kordia sp.]|uniref:AraC family transcriptional regulator n=1 Tax=uncultured Kordia sp. TaxID=507699 RepID=UPI00261FD901|nr:AraC family transcriptional regulator [uncultured Kordia sp.]
MLTYIDEEFKETINIPKIEAACNYSYRNINRIFEAINHETIGKYIKRIRLEKAAQYLKYTHENISEIAYEVGYADVAVFSKAFKKKFNCSPSKFRERNKHIQHHDPVVPEDTKNTNYFDVSFEIETLPDMTILGLEYKGSYEDLKSIDKTWKQLIWYASKKRLLDDTTIHFAEILDDDEITEHIKCRYTSAIVLEDDSQFEPNGFFVKKIIKSRKYAKFSHKGTHESCMDTYGKIYANWMTEIQLEMSDAPVLEFYLNDETHDSSENLITEIYIPIA